MSNRARARELAAEYLAKGDPTGWFEQLYREAETGASVVPWADFKPNPSLLEFWSDRALPTAGKSAIAIGCGLGDDPELLAEWGFETTAFDISQSAIMACQRRFPATRVRYLAADLLYPPATWNLQFDFVFEANTLQVLPLSLRPKAIESIAAFVRAGGSLLVVARGREPSESEGQMPWPLIRSELDAFTRLGLKEQSFEDYFDSESPPVRRFRALYSRPNY